VSEAYRRQPNAHGAVLEKHGLITWGPDGRTSYQRTIYYVSQAERYIAQQRRKHRWSAPAVSSLLHSHRQAWLEQSLPMIRHTVSRTRRAFVSYWDAPEVLEFVNARRLAEVTRLGPATPDHMLRTKRLPLILPATPHALERSLERYAQAHRRYFQRHRQRGQTLQDPYPRVMLMPGVGMLTTGKDLTETAMVAELYTHAMRIMRDASAVGRYTSVSEREAFGVDYWPLELYKLSLAPPDAELSRTVALITGAAGGIGRAIAQALVDRGASVVVSDLSRSAVEAVAEALNQRAGRRRAISVAMDVTSEASITRAFAQVLRAFGGLDVLVSNAGMATVASIEQLSRAQWDRSFAVNATGHFLVARTVMRWLRAQRLGGSMVFIASKNVPAPGKEFGAYSAAKAAETQLARVLAIEGGDCGVRVNIVHPDGVFDGSGLWKAIGPSRAKTYRLPTSRLEAYYQQRNLLKTTITPADVAEAVCFFVSQRSAKTTGCVLTVDGGLREAFPR
jgi:rhamnulose-1-phosphate aldolase/alcohol dehydrogenase